MKMNSTIAMAALACLGAVSGMHGQSGVHTARVGIKEASYLGIGVEDVTPERASKLKLKEERGAYITSVMPDTPAVKAGLQVGDVILEFNGQRVEGMQSLIKLIRDTAAGKSVKLGMWRAGAPLTLWATVGSHKVMESDDGNWSISMPVIPSLPGDFTVPPIDVPKIITVMQNTTLGVEGESLLQQPQLAEYFGVKDGVLVKSVAKNSAAERAGIKAGDVLAKIGDNRISTWRDVASALRYAQPGRTLSVVVVRSKKETPLTVIIEDGR
jgi:serine protease Do